LVLVPPAAESVRKPSVTSTRAVAVRNLSPEAGVNGPTTAVPSALTRCVLSTALPASPTATVTSYVPFGTATCQSPWGLFCTCTKVSSRGSALMFLSRASPTRLTGVVVPGCTQPKPRVAS
jgi:hypothetical protein